MPQAVAGLLLALWCLMFFPAAVAAGHELPYYPSYYPQEIRIESIEASGRCHITAEERDPCLYRW